MKQEKNLYMFMIPIPPQGWKRPGQGKNGRRYDTQKKLKSDIWNFLIRGMNHQPPTKELVEVIATFYVNPPKSLPQKYHNTYCGKKPDLDNYLKLILDACNCIVWKDDSQVVKFSASKVYSISPGIYLEVREIDGDFNNSTYQYQKTRKKLY